MKKMLIIALVGLFYIVCSALVLTKPVPIDQDVGICYVLPSEPVTVNVIIAENNTIAMPDSRNLVLSDVEKSGYNITRIEMQGLYDSCSGQITDQTITKERTTKTTDLGGLLTEYVSPRDGAKSRHT